MITVCVQSINCPLVKNLVSTGELRQIRITISCECVDKVGAFDQNQDYKRTDQSFTCLNVSQGNPAEADLKIPSRVKLQSRS